MNSDSPFFTLTLVLTWSLYWDLKTSLQLGTQLWLSRAGLGYRPARLYAVPAASTWNVLVSRMHITDKTVSSDAKSGNISRNSDTFCFVISKSGWSFLISRFVDNCRHFLYLVKSDCLRRINLRVVMYCWMSLLPA